MDWIKIKEEDYQKSVRLNPHNDTRLLYLSPRPYTPTEEDGDVNMEVTSVKVDKMPNTTELYHILLDLQDEYDKSDEVNVFYIAGQKHWLSKADRVGLVNSLTVQKSLGIETTTLWQDGQPFTVTVDQALEFLKNLELYAIECYNVTQRHLAEISQITSRDELFAYNITADYPSPIEINLSQINED